MSGMTKKRMAQIDWMLSHSAAQRAVRQAAMAEGGKSGSQGVLAPRDYRVRGSAVEPVQAKVILHIRTDISAVLCIGVIALRIRITSTLIILIFLHVSSGRPVIPLNAVSSGTAPAHEKQCHQHDQKNRLTVRHVGYRLRRQKV